LEEFQREVPTTPATRATDDDASDENGSIVVVVVGIHGFCDVWCGVCGGGGGGGDVRDADGSSGVVVERFVERWETAAAG